MKRRNIQEAFVGEPTGDQTQSLDNYAEGDEAVDIGVRGGKVQVVVPAGTSDDDIFDAQRFLEAACRLTCSLCCLSIKVLSGFSGLIC